MICFPVFKLFSKFGSKAVVSFPSNGIGQP